MKRNAIRAASTRIGEYGLVPLEYGGLDGREPNPQGPYP